MPRGALTASVIVVAAIVTVGIAIVAGLGESSPSTDSPAAAEPVERSSFRVFLRGPASEHDALAEPLGAVPGVIDVEYVSKDEALDEFQERIANEGLSDSLGELNSNPLPASYEISFDEFMDTAEARALVTAAAGEDRGLIDQVVSRDLD